MGEGRTSEPLTKVLVSGLAGHRRMEPLYKARVVIEPLFTVLHAPEPFIPVPVATEPLIKVALVNGSGRFFAGGTQNHYIK